MTQEFFLIEIKISTLFCELFLPLHILLGIISGGRYNDILVKALTWPQLSDPRLRKEHMTLLSSWLDFNARIQLLGKNSKHITV